MKIVIDEDLPRSLGRVLQEKGHDVKDVRDSGLRGSPDNKVFEFAQKQEAVLLTGDFGFGNVLRYPPNNHLGILLIHFPNEMPVESVNQEVVKCLESLSTKEGLKQRLVILEPGKMRIRKA